MSQRQGKRVFVITGASGTGKTTVERYLVDHFGMHRVVTHTTRAPRAGEQNGVDYYFETPTSIKQRHLLESVNYSGCIYGSSREGLEAGWRVGKDDVIVLETTGALTYHRLLGQRCVVIFMTVSNPHDLVERQTDRGDDPSAVKSRMTSYEDRRDRQLPAALKGIAHLVVNDSWPQTRKTIDQLVHEIVD